MVLCGQFILSNDSQITGMGVRRRGALENDVDAYALRDVADLASRQLMECGGLN